MGWMTQAKSHPVAHIAAALKLQVTRNTIGPCPSCGASHREHSGRRGPIGTTTDGAGWRCHRCQRTGSTVDLVGLALGVEPTSPETRAWFAARGWCDPSKESPPPPHVKPPPLPPREPERAPPPHSDVERLWADAPPITDDELSMTWVWSRGLDSATLADRDLARVIPNQAPSWARRWRSHYRVLLPLYDATGTLRSVRARKVADVRGQKSLNPKGYTVGGLVFANASGQTLLRDGALGEGARVYLTEGGPDFLTVAAWLSETSPDVVFGIGAGQWTPELAARIPDGTQVFVCTDPNATGRAYAKAVAESLEGRCPVWVPDPDATDPRDLNDRWREGPQAFDPTAGLVRYAVASVPPNGGTCCSETPDGRPYLAAAKGAQGFYVATATGYVFVASKLVRVELQRLWPHLQTRNEEGEPLGAATLYERFGRRVDDVIFSYTSRTRFEKGPNHGGKLFLQVLQEPPPPAVFHADVDEWLRLAFNERTLDWLATMPELGQPTSALWLYGAKGIGKSMIAEACSAYFGSAVTDYDDVFKGRLNDALLRCPIMHLDEQAEVKASTGVMRKRIANSRHAIEAKGEPSGTLHGCPRLIICSNNPDPMGWGREALTRMDNDAIGDRMLIVDCNPAAERWLKERGGRQGVTSDWLERSDGSRGRLVEHIAWLVQNRTVERDPRFLVPGDAAEWSARVGTREGLPRTILDALACYLEMSPAERNWVDDKYPPFLWHPNYADTVLISVPGLIRNWRPLVGAGEPVPSPVKTGKALQILTNADGPTRIRLRAGDDKRVRLYLLPESVVARHVGA
ncbi:MAG: primase-helicase family protein [Myxococcota bacterium]